MALFEGEGSAGVHKVIRIAGWVLVVFLGVSTLSALMGLRYIGTGVPATNTISVMGHGEHFAAPDIATFTYSVVSEKASVADAQTDATQKANAAMAYLKSAGVEEKDIQTINYSVTPQYDYRQAVCPAVEPAMSARATSISYCPPGKQVLRGYEVRQTTRVKVRDTKKAGELLTGVGSKGATEVSGLQFTFDDPKMVETKARDKAIADAKQKAEVLAKQLGVSLVRVVSYNEVGGPRAYEAYGMGGGVASKVAAPAPDIAVGENQTTSNVSITYEIR